VNVPWSLDPHGDSPLFSGVLSTRSVSKSSCVSSPFSTTGIRARIATHRPCPRFVTSVFNFHTRNAQRRAAFYRTSFIVLPESSFFVNHSHVLCCEVLPGAPWIVAGTKTCAPLIRCRPSLRSDWRESSGIESISQDCGVHGSRALLGSDGWRRFLERLACHWRWGLLRH